MELPRHKLVIFTDGGQDDLCPIATGAQLDGREILVPGGHTITTSIGDGEALIAVVPVLVSDVDYRKRPRASSGFSFEPQRAKAPRSWGRFWPIRRLRRG